MSPPWHLLAACKSSGSSFVIATLSCLGKPERADMEILEEFPMSPGDLYVLEGDVNARFGHAVPRDPRVKELRVSWVFRTVDVAYVHRESNTVRVVQQR